MESAFANFGAFGLVLIVLIGGIRWLAAEYKIIQAEARVDRERLVAECQKEREKQSQEWRDREAAAEARHDQSRAVQTQRIEALESKIETALATQLERSSTQLERSSEAMSANSQALDRLTAAVVQAEARVSGIEHQNVRLIGVRQ